MRLLLTKPSAIETKKYFDRIWIRCLASLKQYLKVNRQKLLTQLELKLQQQVHLQILVTPGEFCSLQVRKSALKPLPHHLRKPADFGHLRQEEKEIPATSQHLRLPRNQSLGKEANQVLHSSQSGDCLATKKLLQFDSEAVIVQVKLSTTSKFGSCTSKSSSTTGLTRCMFA